LVNKLFDIIDARCNNEDFLHQLLNHTSWLYIFTWFTSPFDKWNYDHTGWKWPVSTNSKVCLIWITTAWLFMTATAIRTCCMLTLALGSDMSDHRL